MPEDINHLDTKDEGLKAIFGDRFHDETAEAPQTAKATHKPRNTTQPEKAAQKPAQNHTKETEGVQDVKWQPVKPDPNWLDHLKNSVKWTMLFGGLSCLVFYWEQAGLMAESIAVPCIAVCTALAGYGIGKNVVRGER